MLKLCAYCSVPLIKNLNKSKDHVPPKCFWGDSKPNNLITVPSCKSCNNDASEDDTYTFLHHTMRGELSDDLVQEFIEPFKKTVNHNQGLAKEILKNCQDVPALLKGFQVDTLHLVSPKWKRMEAVMERTARGLIYHHYDTIICEDKTIIRTFALDCIRKVDIKTKELLKSICQHSEIHSIGETFLYSTFQFHGNYVVFMVVNKSVEYVSIFTDREIDMANMNKKRRQARNRRKAFKRSRKNK